MSREKENSTPTSIRIDKELIERVKKDAKLNGRSLTKEIEQIIIKYYETEKLFQRNAK